MNQTQVSDIQKEKLCLIEDIIKCRKMLFGFGIEGHKDAVFNPGQLFDIYYDMDKKVLSMELDYLSSVGSEWAKNLIGAQNETFLKPGN